MFKKTDIVSFLLLCLLVVCFVQQDTHRLLMVLVACAPMVLITILARTFSVTALFRIFVLFTTFLPIENTIHDLLNFQSVIYEYQDYLRTGYSFWQLTLYLLPIFALLLVCARRLTGQAVAKKYLPAAILLAVLFLAGIVFPDYRTLCQFLFLFVATFAVAHLEEIYVYRKCDSLLAHLPFYYLVVSNVLKIKGGF